MTNSVREFSEDDVKQMMAKAWNMDVADIPSDASFNNMLQWDSLGHVTLLVAFEKECQIKINYDTLTQLIDIPSILKYLKEQSC